MVSALPRFCTQISRLGDRIPASQLTHVLRGEQHFISVIICFVMGTLTPNARPVKLCDENDLGGLCHHGNLLNDKLIVGVDLCESASPAGFRAKVKDTVVHV